MKLTIEKDGSAVVSNVDEGRENPPAKEGDKPTPAVDRWSMPDAEQLGRHMRGVESKEHPFSRLSKGDVDAARDAAHEFAKQRNS